jgi:hypothetical protein
MGDDGRVSEDDEQSSETAPQGARIRRADGSTVECDVRRGRDWGFYRGYARWEAVAREAVRLDYDRDRFECDTVPTRTVMCFHVDLLPGGDGWPRADEGWVTKVTETRDFPCPEGGTGLMWPTMPGPLPGGDGPFACDYPAVTPYPCSRGVAALG